MFYFYAIGSMLAYALQQTLLVHHARRIDGLSLAFYRNISFCITLLPLLLVGSAEDFRLVLSQWPLLLLSGIAGSIYLALLFASYKFLTVGLGTSISRAMSAVSIVSFGWLMLGEQLSWQGIAVIGVILVGALLLGLQHTHMPHLDSRFTLGIACAALGAIPVAIITYVLTVLSRQASPFVSGYFWEISIGIACLGLLLLRWMFFGKPIQAVDKRTFLLIAACASPTLIGTAFLSLAVRSGPIGIVNAIGTGLLVVAAILGHIWYHEKITKGQWAGIMLIMAGIIVLRFV